MPIFKPKKSIVTQANKLVESRSRMTLMEKRLLWLGMSKIDPRKTPEQSDPACFEVSALEFKNVFPDIANPWRDLRKAATQLQTRRVHFQDKERRAHSTLNWFDSVYYAEGEGYVIMRFSWSVHQLIAGILEQYTRFPLVETQHISTTYGMKLFELLRQFQSTGYRQISVEDYRFSMDCVEKYKAMSELKRRTLLPALRDLNKHTDLDIKYKDIRQGKRITHFIFIFDTQLSLI